MTIRIRQGTRARTAGSGRPEIPQLTMPAPPWCELPGDEAYAWGVSLGSAITRARQGGTTELCERDGTVAALLAPPPPGAPS